MIIKKAVIVSLLSLSLPSLAQDKPQYFGAGLCEEEGFECIKIERGQNWENLFPDEDQRDIVQRVNRTYNNLWPGKILAVPKNLAKSSLLDFAPFPLKINDPDHEKQIIVDQEKLAYAAYNADGNLVKWGPVASGSDKCSDNSSSTCRTMTGIFRVFSKEQEKCKSNVFPLGKGGARMPFCMYFHKGIALHGSDDIPGYRASHGCIRMFIRDAKWLNHEFVESSRPQNNNLGTKVVVRPLNFVEKKQ